MPVSILESNYELFYVLEVEYLRKMNYLLIYWAIKLRSLGNIGNCFHVTKTINL